MAIVRKYFKDFIIVWLIAFAGSSCAVPPPMSAATPAYQTVQVTREVTQLVTRVVEVPVTVVPSDTPVSNLTPTPIPSITNLIT